MQESLSATPHPGYPLARYAVPVVLVCVVHAAVLALLWRAAPVSAAAPQVLDVVMISAPVPEVAPPAPVPPPKPEPVKPKVEPVKPKPEPVLRVPAPKPVPQAVPEPAPAPVAPPPAAVVPSATPVEAPPVVIPPRVDASYRGNPKPRYPPASERLGEKGTVLLNIYVKEDGSVGEIELKKSSGYSRLDQSAMTTVKQWKLVPARRGNEPIAMWYLLPIKFGE
jgi:protein TonB